MRGRATKLTAEQQEFVLREYENGCGKSCRDIAKILNEYPQVIRNFLKRNGVKVRIFWPGAKRERNAHWKGGQKISAGRMWLLRPEHPRCNSNGYIRRSHAVMEEIIGRYLFANEVVHHKDRNTMNDDPDNLELYSSNRVHMRLHQKDFCRNSFGQFVQSRPS